MIAKMVQIAERLGATVQGDDGEIYRQDGSSYEPDVPNIPGTAPTPQGIIGRMSQWFSARRAAKKFRATLPPFRVGQRVKNPWGVVGTVTLVDARADGGLGRVRFRTDDGHEHDMALIASGLEIVDEGSGGK
jgi:hypothetical protein